MADVEKLAGAVHQAYLDTCERLGWPVKPENQVSYAELSEDSKELDRASVRAVLSHPEAVKVLLETGALEHIANWHEVNTPGHECWHNGSDYCSQRHVGRMIPLYRLANEESPRG
jgi:hypothetical protein